MADIHMTGSHVGYRAQGASEQGSGAIGARVGTYANAAGAVVSLALLVGVGIWGYQLLVRDVSGVPVVRAAEGPWRVAPEDPGGLAADHQGLAVNEVAGRGSASGPVAQVALAPRPIGLDADEDIATVQAHQAVVTQEETDTPVQPLAARSPVTRSTPAATETGSTIMTNRVGAGTPRREISDTTIQALADQIADDVKPLSASAPIMTPAVKTKVTTPSRSAAAINAPGVRRSPRPRKRPAEVVRTSLATPVAPVAEPATQQVDAATLPAGTRLVQLGAYESAAIAEDEWGRISGRFASFFDSKSRVIQKAQSGGRTFYRLRAHGFEDLADARRFCALLVAEGPDCIPVVTK